WRRFAALAAVVVLLVAAGVIARKVTSGGASAATLLEDVPPPATLASVTPPATEMPIVAAVPDSANADSSAATADSSATTSDSSPATGGSSTAPAGSGAAPAGTSGAERTALLEVSPAGTSIALVGNDDARWLDRAELTVAEGDSLLVRLVRRGYVPRTVVFRGEPLTVALVPDSVTVRFQANIPAEVYVD